MDRIILSKATVKYILANGTELIDIDENGKIADKKYSEVLVKYTQEVKKHCSNYNQDKVSEIIKSKEYYLNLKQLYK